MYCKLNVKMTTKRLKFNYIIFFNYLKLKSGDAHRTATLGICGTSLIAIVS